MSTLESVLSGVEQHPPRIIIYGENGVGKSTWASKAPNPIFIDTESGLARIDCKKYPKSESFDDVLENIQELAGKDHGFQTVVIDSIDWLERLIFDKLCAKNGVDSIDKVDKGWGRGYNLALNYWRELIEALDWLRSNKGMASILIAHAKIERFEDPSSLSYDRFSPRIHKTACALLAEWSDATLFATKKFRTQKEEANFGRERVIAVGVGQDGGEKILKTTGSPACVAKNRYNLPVEIPLDWEVFASYLK